MIVCDCCKLTPIGKNRSKAKPFDYQIVGTKVEDPSTKSAAKKAVAREVVKIDLHLCDDCITIFNQRLGAFIHAMKTNEPMDLENDLSRPVGVTEHAEVDSRAVVGPGPTPESRAAFDEKRALDLGLKKEAFNTAGTVSGRMTSGLPNPAPDNIKKGSPEAAAAFGENPVATKTLAGSDTYGNE